MLVSLLRFRRGNPTGMDCTAGSPRRASHMACDRLPRGWLGRLLDAVGGWWFRADDRAAIQYGWQITTHHGGLSRSYRDPRFDTLHACLRCNGSGWRDEEPCAPCSGTGRVSRTVSSPEGQLR